MRNLSYSYLTTLDPNMCLSSLETDNNGVPISPFQGQPHIWDETQDAVRCSECGVFRDDLDVSVDDLPI